MVAELLEVRKHAGMIVPRPVQQAMIALLGDQEHVLEQRERYLARRAVLRPALEAAGFRIDHSEGSIYLWATRDEDSWASVDFLAGHGILVAPGPSTEPPAHHHVRIALTATDERIAAAAAAPVNAECGGVGHRPAIAPPDADSGSAEGDLDAARRQLASRRAIRAG